MPPEGLDAVEPYAYDIFALSKTLEMLTVASKISVYSALSLTKFYNSAST